MTEQNETEQNETEQNETEQNQQAYADIAQRAEFADLKRRYQAFAFPATAAFMIWYLTYVICNNWARDLMDTPVIGHVNVALVFGLLQFVSTFLIAYLYSRHANKALDPLATQLREEFEGRGR